MTTHQNSVAGAGPPPSADESSVASALADVALLGGFFAISRGTVPPAPPEREPAGWVPAGAAYQQGMAELAAQTGRALGTREHRVAVSTLQLGYAARLWSPALACALAHGIVPDLGGLEVSTGLPLRVRLPSPAGWRTPDTEATPGWQSPDTAATAGWQSPDTDTAADLLYDVVVTGHLAPLAAGLRGRVASGLLWGNAASAMMGSLTVLVRARPRLAGPARSVAARLLVTGTLRGTGRLTGSGLGFRRNSCCLYYRVPGGGLCGDCSLDNAGH